MAFDSFFLCACRSSEGGIKSLQGYENKSPSTACTCLETNPFKRFYLSGVPRKSVEPLCHSRDASIFTGTELDPWESRIVKIFVTISMQINLTNAHPQGAREQQSFVSSQSRHKRTNQFLVKPAISQSLGSIVKAREKNIIIKRDLSDFKIGQRDVLRINFAQVNHRRHL